MPRRRIADVNADGLRVSSSAKRFGAALVATRPGESQRHQDHRRRRRRAAAAERRPDPQVMSVLQRIARIKAVARERVYRSSLIGQRSPVFAVFDSDDISGAIRDADAFRLFIRRANPTRLNVSGSS